MATVIELPNSASSNGVTPTTNVALIDGSGAGASVGALAGKTGTGSYLAIDPAHAAARISRHPIDVTGGGAYRVCFKSGSTGLTGLSAASPILSIRMASTTLNALITRIRWAALVTTVAGTAGVLDFGLFFARSFSAADSGGTALTLTTNNAKKRTSYATCALAIQYGTTGELTAGTRTLDANPLAVQGSWLTTSALGDTGFGLSGEYDATEDGDQEGFLLSGPNKEGLVLANIAAQPTSSVIQMYYEIDWKELLLTSY